MLGSIVPETTLELSYLKDQFDQLCSEQLQYELQNDPETNNAIDPDHSEKLLSVSNAMKSVYQKINSSPVDDCLWGLEYIPWDNKCVVRVIQGRNPYLENFFKIQFTNIEGVDSTMEALIKDLVTGMPNGYSKMICPQTVKAATRQIKTVLKNELAIELKDTSTPLPQVELYASFIRLDRVRSYDCLFVQKNAVLSDNLTNNASSLYVISECLLGGLFFGLRSKTSSEEDNCFFNCKEMSVFSKGTISTIALNDLDISYKKWKDSLLNDPNTGYPIAYKVKNFKEIM